MLRFGRGYLKQGTDKYAARMRANAERSVRKKAAALGVELTPWPAAATT
jgi:hypothetical protein